MPHADEFAAVRTIADQWAATADDADARARLAADLLARLSVGDVRALRLAGEAARAITPDVIHAEAGRGAAAHATAAALGMRESYVYRVLRDRPTT